MSHQEKGEIGGQLRMPASDGGAGARARLPALAEIQHAKVQLRFGKNARFKARADITNGGLLSIAVLVSGILLSTAVLVQVAVQDPKSRWR